MNHTSSPVPTSCTRSQAMFRKLEPPNREMGNRSHDRSRRAATLHALAARQAYRRTIDSMQ